jgi:hypothetical protein
MTTSMTGTKTFCPRCHYSQKVNLIRRLEPVDPTLDPN